MTILANQQLGWSRTWACKGRCTLNSSVDLSRLPSASIKSSLDLSVVNVFSLSESEECRFGVISTSLKTVLENALIVVNASLDLSESRCTAVYVSVFDLAGGVFKNVSVAGEIHIKLSKENMVG